jgi:hypothetical protein
LKLTTEALAEALAEANALKIVTNKQGLGEENNTCGIP